MNAACAVINCTDPRQGRTDVETVDWDGSLSWRSNVTLRCTQPGYEFFLGSGAWAVLLNLTCDQVSVLQLRVTTPSHSLARTRAGARAWPPATCTTATTRPPPRPTSSSPR